jgi:hypothetical protein
MVTFEMSAFEVYGFEIHKFHAAGLGVLSRDNLMSLVFLLEAGFPSKNEPPPVRKGGFVRLDIFNIFNL